jgi:pimeloyl-ACP methyl ester carboxylesterase
MRPVCSGPERALHSGHRLCDLRSCHIRRLGGVYWSMDTLHFTRSGNGQPLLLLHGLGSARHAWDPIVPMLADHFDVLAVDLPGFGSSDPLPPSVEPTPARIGAIVASLLDDLGVATPHVAGNSLGGWVALEFARLSPVQSLTLLSPAGLWRNDTPLYQMISLRTTCWLARHAGTTLSRLVATRVGRNMVLRQTHGRPGNLAPNEARAAIGAMAGGSGFDATLSATARRRYVATGPIDVPVTVAFGSRDLLLLRRSRYLSELPPHAQHVTLPQCGHVPMYDDPCAVSTLIISTAHGVCGQRETRHLPTMRPRCLEEMGAHTNVRAIPISVFRQQFMPKIEGQ